MGPLQESLNQLTHRVQVSSLQSQDQNNKQSIDNQIIFNHMPEETTPNKDKDALKKSKYQNLVQKIVLVIPILFSCIART